MGDISLIQVAVLLAAAGIVVPLARFLRVGAVLGYLIAGIAIGPYMLGFFKDPEEILHVGEFGVVLLLFMIGLQLKPQRLWAMRRAVFGIGSWQVAITAALLTALTFFFLDTWREALFVGLALALSSTALAIQLLKETGDLELRHGRLAFSVLLFQDLAAIPMIAFVGVLAVSDGSDESMSIQAVLTAVGAIVAIMLVGRFLLGRAFHAIALTGATEAMTALGLLTIVLIEIIMKNVGLSSALGAFIAGALLADSTYRHEIEADIKPFEILLLGLFFISIGMALDLDLLLNQTGIVAASVVGLMLIKALVLNLLGRYYGLAPEASRRFACSLSQGGEFAFVLTAIAVSAGVIARDLEAFVNVIVTVTMLVTPMLLLVEKKYSTIAARRANAPDYDELPESESPVILAGLGRFGQIIARVLAARGIPFTALDGDPSQIDVIRRFGGQVFFGDATRPEIMASAQVDKARAVVVCIANVEASIAVVDHMRRQYPHVPVFARARDRDHAHQLMALGCERVIRETFLSAAEMSRYVLIAAGLTHNEAEKTVQMFKDQDELHLADDFSHFADPDRLVERARQHAEELAELFKSDTEGRD